MSDSCMYCGAFRNGPHFSNCPTQRGRVEKRFIFGGLIAGLLFAVGLFAHGAVAQDENYRFHVAGTLNAPDLKSLNALNTTNLFVNGKEVLSLLRAPAGSPIITVVHPDGTVDPRPLSAIVVTQCGLAVSLFVQLDATHLLRADPRQSDMFTAKNGEQVQSQAGPMKIDDAMMLAKAAVLSTNVTLPCTDDPVT